MAVLLHVQGSGRDPLRPFGGHAIRTVAWERFDPGSVGQDVDTIIISAPDAVGGLDAVTAIRDAGDNHPVLLVPDDSPGWRTVAASRLPGADVVLGGIRSLPDYIPSADYPHESGVWDDLEQGEDTREAARVIDLRRHIPRGGSRRLLRERLGDQPNDIAAAVREFTEGLTGDRAPVPDADTAAQAAPGGYAPDQSPAEEDPFHRPVPSADPTPAAPSDHRGRRVLETATLGVGTDRADRPTAGSDLAPPHPALVDTAPHDTAPHDTASQNVAAHDQPEAGNGAGEVPAPRRMARALSDPAILVPALLTTMDRLPSVAQAAAGVAEFVALRLVCDAVDVITADGPMWRTVHTAGAATGAGATTDIVDMAGLVDWLDTFDSPVVLDGHDLAAPGSWVLAAPARADGVTVAVILCWRDPGGPVFDPASVATLGDLAADATSALDLALQVRRLARGLSSHAY